MEELDKYIEKVKQKINNIEQQTKEKLKEEEIVMLVYIDLGNILSFDQDFYFGGTKKSKQIYLESSSDFYLDKIFKRKKIVCQSASKILEYILRNLKINIKTVTDYEDNKKFHHVCNIIYPKDNSEPYSIDLQDDIENIRYHTLTKSFGLSLDNQENYVISRQRQKEIHEKIGYISRKNPYTEEYLYLLKYDMMQMDDIYEKLDHVLTHIEPYDNIEINYWEKRWKHEKILDELFPNRQLEKIIHRVECFKRNENNEKQFINCYYIQKKENIIVYYYEQQTNEYKKYNVYEFAQKIIEENIELTREQKIPKLNSILNQMKRKK